MTRVEPSQLSRAEARSYDQWMFRQSDDIEDQVSVYYLEDQNYMYPPPYSNNPPPPYEAYAISRSHPTSRPKYGQQTPTIHQPIPLKDSFAGHIVLSCFVIWLCGGLLGSIAFFVAMIASRKASNGDQLGARYYGSASYSLSVLGIIVGVLLWVVVIVMLTITSNGISGVDYNGNI